MQTDPVVRNKSELRVSVVTPETLPNDKFRKALNFWLGHKGEAELPPVSAINAFTIPKDLLPNISIVSVEDGPKRFFVRLVGTGIVRAVGKDTTGQWGEDIEGRENVLPHYINCVKDRRPIYHEGPVLWPHIDFKLHQNLLMPFADASGEVVRVVGYLEHR